MARIVLIPGSARGAGQVHWVPAQRLAELYGVPFEECVVWDWRTDAGKAWRPAPTDITLYVDTSGRYTMSEDKRAAIEAVLAQRGLRR